MDKDQNKPIFRYVDVEQMMFMLEFSALPFINVSTWEDPFEGVEWSYIRASLENELDNTQDGDRKETLECLMSLGHDYEEYCYGSSWTFREESDAMWRIYSPNCTGVKIKSTFSRLEKLNLFTYDVCYLDNPPEQPEGGVVHLKRGYSNFSHTTKKVSYYQNHPKIEELFGQAYKPVFNMFFQKRMAFEHEAEVRKLVQTIYPTGLDIDECTGSA